MKAQTFDITDILAGMMALLLLLAMLFTMGYLSISLISALIGA